MARRRRRQASSSVGAAMVALARSPGHARAAVAGGEDEAWAALVLAALLAGFAAGYWWLGVPAEAARGPWWRRGMEALLYSVQAGTHVWVDFYAKPGPAAGALGVRWLYLAESILVPVQFGFFVFALRNRFRR